MTERDRETPAAWNPKHEIRNPNSETRNKFKGRRRNDGKRSRCTGGMNPKHEIRNPKLEINSKEKEEMTERDRDAPGRMCFEFSFSSFEFISDFGFRISCFPPGARVLNFLLFFLNLFRISDFGFRAFPGAGLSPPPGPTKVSANLPGGPQWACSTEKKD